MVLRNGARFKRGAKRLAGGIKRTAGEKYEMWKQVRSEKKRIYKEAFIRAERGAIKQKARMDARRRVLGEPSLARRIKLSGEVVRRRRKFKPRRARRFAPELRPAPTPRFTLFPERMNNEFTLFPRPRKKGR